GDQPPAPPLRQPVEGREVHERVRIAQKGHGLAPLARAVDAALVAHLAGADLAVVVEDARLVLARLARLRLKRAGAPLRLSGGDAGVRARTGLGQPRLLARGRLVVARVERQNHAGDQRAEDDDVSRAPLPRPARTRSARTGH